MRTLVKQRSVLPSGTPPGERALSRRITRHYFLFRFCYVVIFVIRSFSVGAAFFSAPRLFISTLRSEADVEAAKRTNRKRL